MNSKTITINLLIQSVVLIGSLLGEPNVYPDQPPRPASCPPASLSLTNDTNSVNPAINLKALSLDRSFRPSIYRKHDCVMFACPCSFEFDAVYRALRRSPILKEIPTNLFDVKQFVGFGTNIILYLCGKGGTAATYSTSRLVNKAGVTCDAIFMLGTCGSVVDDIKPGDICIPRSFHNAAAGRYIGTNSSGDVSRKEGKGINYHGQYPDYSELVLEPSKDLISFVTYTVNDNKNENVFRFVEFSENYIGIERVPATIVWPEGLASMGSFTHSPSMASFISAAYESEIVDMETYPLADFCEKSNIPFIAVRVPSDDAGRSGVNMMENGGRFIASQNLGIVAGIIAESLVNI